MTRATSTACRRCAVVTGVLCILVAGTIAHAQEPLAVAKIYYASAAYEDALSALRAVPATAEPVEVTEATAYRAFCLFALGRSEEARAAVESLVRLDPSYRPTDAQASPRVRAFFDDVRRPVLGTLARETYAAARESLKREEPAVAADGFDRVLGLLAEIGDSADPDIADLRALTEGFRDLARLATEEAAAEAEAAKARAAETPVAPEPDPEHIYTDEDPGVVKPDVVSRAMPPWQFPAGVDARRAYSGVLEVIIERDGRVETAAMRDSVHPLYDPILLRAARSWRFAPATRDGVPVRYRYLLGVRIGGQ